MRTYEFAYRIDKRAKLAYDIETGEPDECYAKIQFEECKNDISVEQYREMHESMREKFKVPIEYVVPISMDEYWRETEEEAK